MLAGSAPPGASAMSTQKREPGKNYIGLMIDDEEQRATEPTGPSDRHMQDYFLGLVAAVLIPAATQGNFPSLAAASTPNARGQKLRCALTCSETAS
jgi:hypothetical protein